ncbi:HAD family hydrolase [Pseudoalteromonas sp. JB197]|uniref:HAD family hydrolase n=1 Tax=Pseudoalteromonas sp. JB197 TaxID=1434839 RepID=UPI00097EFFDB|nr:HAD family hydrolase [Pseudoalteromonas sp. JB197]PCC10235.1 hydrolase [Pseudoalteromonas sp. JB197]SJN43503.1 Putative phosphatase YieH [Pseudoalteromonas sp. JB197]
MNAKIDLVIFDCDGVVIDSEILSAQVLIDMLAYLTVNIDRGYVQQHFLGCNFKTVSQKIQNAFNVTLPNSFEDDYREALLNEFGSALSTTDGINEVLNNLAVPKCIATSSSPARTAKALDIVNLSNCFSNAIFTSSEVKRGKPAPDLFLHAAKQMGVKPEHCLVIEDSEAGVCAAINANMQVLHYSGGQHMQTAINYVRKAYPNVAHLTHWQQFFTAYPALKSKNI